MPTLEKSPPTPTPIYTSLRTANKLIALEAQRGFQGGTEYWSSMVPFSKLIHLLVFQDKMMKPGKETQRHLNVRRVKKIAEYVKANQGRYVLSGLTVSLDACNFEPVHPESSLGTLFIHSKSRYLVNDGQHRVAGLKLLMADHEMREALEIDTITIDFRMHGSDARQRQIFSDLNLNAQKPAKGLSHYFDGTDPVAAVTRQLISDVPQFGTHVNFQKNQLGKKDVHVWTFKAIYDAVQLSVKHLEKFEPADVISHWRQLVNSIVEWQLVSLLTTDEALTGGRRENICFSAVGMSAIAQAFPVGSTVPDLSGISWSRSESHWDNVCLFDGKLRKNPAVITQTAALIKSLSES